MSSNNYPSQQNNQLNKRIQLASIALWTITIGAGFAISASVYSYLQNGWFPLTTFFTAILGLVAAYPVFKEKQQLRKRLTHTA